MPAPAHARRAEPCVTATVTGFQPCYGRHPGRHSSRRGEHYRDSCNRVPLKIPPAATHKNGIYVIAGRPKVRRKRRPDFHCRMWRSEAPPSFDHAKTEFFSPRFLSFTGFTASEPNPPVLPSNQKAARVDTGRDLHLGQDALLYVGCENRSAKSDLRKAICEKRSAKSDQPELRSFPVFLRARKPRSSG